MTPLAEKFAGGDVDLIYAWVTLGFYDFTASKKCALHVAQENYAASLSMQIRYG